MKPKKDLKEIVRKKYSEIAGGEITIYNSCCSFCGCSPKEGDSKVYTLMSESYHHLKGYHAEADMGLGCGIPTEFAGIKPGDVVVDLGSGAGNDCFVARSETGESGKVIGIDFTDEMIEKARQNLQKLGYSNVTFLKGDIEDIPLDDETADVVVSNCVLNLVPDKEKAFSEIFRILKRGGHFCVSDIVVNGNLPEKLKEDVEMYAGCVAGAISQENYLNIIQKSGFHDIIIHKIKPIILPPELSGSSLSPEDASSLPNDNYDIFSITISGIK